VFSTLLEEGFFMNHKKSSSNLFDYGKSSQTEIIKPFMDKVRNYPLSNGLDSSFRSFFMTQLRNSLVMIEEHVEVPLWVEDFRKYKSNLEIVVFLSLFGSIDRTLNDKEKEKKDIEDLYSLVSEFGSKRNWDLDVLSLQFIRLMGNSVYNYILMGNSVYNYILNIIFPQKLNPSDYN